MKNDYDAPEDESYDDIYESDGLRWMSIIIVVLVVFGFFSLAWYAYQSNTDTQIQSAELNLIEADTSPYREAPEDPGGMQFEHQDKEVYNQLVAGEKNKTKEVERLLPSPEQPVRVRAPEGSDTKSWVNRKLHPKHEQTESIKKETKEQLKKEAKPKAKTTIEDVINKNLPKTEPKPVVKEVTKKVIEKPKTPPTPKEKIGISNAPAVVQVASLRSNAEAKRMWSKLNGKHSDLLGNRSYQIARAEIPGKGTYYRLQVAAKSKSDATSLCNALKRRGQSCLVTK